MAQPLRDDVQRLLQLDLQQVVAFAQERVAQSQRVLHFLVAPTAAFAGVAEVYSAVPQVRHAPDETTDLLEVPAASLRSMMELPELNTLINEKLIERLGRTSSTDFVRLNRPDQGDLRDLRRRRPKGAAGARV